jgi:hypothetical protein
MMQARASLLFGTHNPEMQGIQALHIPIKSELMKGIHSEFYQRGYNNDNHAKTMY